MNYTKTLLEDAVEKLYKKLEITDPNHPIDDVARKLNIELHYFEKFPFAMRGTITLDPRLPKKKQKEVFAHELAHVMYHVGIQIIMPESFREKQEYQARNFAFHFCIPTFMMKQMDLHKDRYRAVEEIADTFGVTNKFADERLIHYEKQINGFLFHQELLKCSEQSEKYTSKINRPIASIDDGL